LVKLAHYEEDHTMNPIAIIEKENKGENQADG